MTEEANIESLDDDDKSYLDRGDSDDSDSMADTIVTDNDVEEIEDGETEDYFYKRGNKVLEWRWEKRGSKGSRKRVVTSIEYKYCGEIFTNKTTQILR